MAELDRDGVRIHYEVHGSGPALLLTPGFSATARMWEPQLEAFSERFTLVLWDMRGHGRSASPQRDAAYGETLTTGDMAALLDAVDVSSAIVGGLSLGGYMSLAFHADHPDRVDALLLVDTGPGYRSDTAREAWNRTALRQAEVLERDGEQALRGRSSEQATAHHDDIVGLAYAARNMLTQSSARVIDGLPQIAVPALVVVGADDEPYLAAADYMARKIPRARKVVIPDAGHAVNLDQPEAFNRAVLDFLR